MRRSNNQAGAILIICGSFGLATPLLSRLLSNNGVIMPWIIDLAAHFQWLYLSILILGILLSIRKNKKFLWAAILIPAPWITAHEAAPVGSTTVESVKILNANINFRNYNIEPLITLINSEKPDFVVLVELSHNHAETLAELSNYPYQYTHPDNSPFGIGILSKLPLSNITTNWTNTNNKLQTPSIEVTSNLNGHSIKIVAFHPMPPITYEYHLSRNMQIKTMVNESKQNEIPTIIAGDFNATPWSSAFTDIDFKRASSLSPTWPTKYLGIPIDQVLISHHWNIIESYIGADIGSDHLPTIIRAGISQEE